MCTLYHTMVGYDIMTGMTIAIFLIKNILFFAIPLALVEICIEKGQGWGGGLSKDKWYAKSILRNTKLGAFIQKITKLDLPLNFHLIISYVIYPIFLILDYVFLSKNIFLIIAGLFVIMMCADFSWFAFNWNFDSLTELTKGPTGNIFWHKKWVKISATKYIPIMYVEYFLFATIFVSLAIVYGFLWR